MFAICPAVASYFERRGDHRRFVHAGVIWKIRRADQLSPLWLNALPMAFILSELKPTR
jgi:hypothetical protein